MSYISIPLQINNKGFLREESLDKSIAQSISMLLQTPCQSCVTDPQYGFVFKNLRFEIFNESDGTIYNSMDNIPTNDRRLYNMKASGSSKNVNTFASELKAAIDKYEPRLSDVNATMTYIREEKKIYISVNGVITETGKEYSYNTIIRIWN